ncbi:hypothetical protein KCU87_g79, partial [Aureobasidium melanogenum]
MLLAQSEEQTKDTRLLTESQKDEKEPERSEIETSQGKHRFCPEKTAHAIVAVGSHAVSSTTCKEVYLFLILAALTFLYLYAFKLFCLDFDIAAMDVLPMNSRGS